MLRRLLPVARRSRVRLRNASRWRKLWRDTQQWAGPPQSLPMRSTTCWKLLRTLFTCCESTPHWMKRDENSENCRRGAISKSDKQCTSSNDAYRNVARSHLRITESDALRSSKGACASTCSTRALAFAHKIGTSCFNRTRQKLEDSIRCAKLRLTRQEG